MLKPCATRLREQVLDECAQPEKKLDEHVQPVITFRWDEVTRIDRTAQLQCSGHPEFLHTAQERDSCSKATQATLERREAAMAIVESITDADLSRVRKTPDGRLAGPDLVAVLIGQRGHAGMPWKRLCEEHPDIRTASSLFQFGRGRPTPTVDAKTAIKIVMVMPGRAAAVARERMATIVCRYAGGDLSLLDEVRQIDAAHRAAPYHPMSVFRQYASASTDDWQRQIMEQESAARLRKMEAEELRATEEHKAKMAKDREERQAWTDEQQAKLAKDKEERRVWADEQQAKLAKDKEERRVWADEQQAKRQRREDEDATQRAVRLHQGAEHTRQHLLTMAALERETLERLAAGHLTQEQSNRILGVQRRLITKPLGRVVEELGFADVVRSVKNFAQRLRQAYLAQELTPKPQTDWVDGIADAARGRMLVYDTDLPQISKVLASLRAEIVKPSVTLDTMFRGC
jgi:hypothetical protein